MKSELSHVPVLVDEVVDALMPREFCVLIDCTFGRGGHTRRLLENMRPDAKLIVLDQDPSAISVAKGVAEVDPRVTVIHANFGDLCKTIRENQITQIGGVLFDLGVSSPQLDEASRGFSFAVDGPLDMRMDNSAGIAAGQWLAEVDRSRLIEVLKNYGEERYANRIAEAILVERSQRSIETTMELSNIVSRAVPRRDRHKHPSTRTFQAIRIAINEELDQLKKGLSAAIDSLTIGGRVAVISFHSLEDRLVKRMFRERAYPDTGPFVQPLPDVKPTLKIVGKPVRPTISEQQKNPRSRSATLRVAEKCAQ